MKREQLSEKIRYFLLYQVGAKILWTFEKLIPEYSLIGETAFFEATQFQWSKELETNWHLIRQELEQILKVQE
ncbi:MAG: aspartyl/asparaginyl beta-hydroxylase domain-containing protein, partial [Planktothrix sp.]